MIRILLTLSLFISTLYATGTMSAMSHTEDSISGQIVPDSVFSYTSPEGSVFIFIADPDGIHATLAAANAAGVETLMIPECVGWSDKQLFVKKIENFAFCPPECPQSMKDVRKLIISEGIEYAGQGCFSNSGDLEEVFLPASLMNISYGMFEDCPKLRSVYIPEESGLKEIGDFAFMNCTRLESFHIPGHVASIAQAPWRNCISLKEIGVSEYNPYFNTYDGVLYSGDRKHLVQYPAGKEDQEYSVMFGTQSIDNAAFYGNMHLSRVTFPASVDSISHQAFYKCLNLKDVVFTDKVSVIGNVAFRECPSLKEITLYGNPRFTVDSAINGHYDTFMPETKVTITENIPEPNITVSEKGILGSVWLTISQLPYFQTMEVTGNKKFPKYFGKGTATVYGNSDPKPDVLRILGTIPENMLAHEDTDSKGRMTRLYLDPDGKKSRSLYVRIGIGGNDLVVIFFDGGDRKKIAKALADLK